MREYWALVAFISLLRVAKMHCDANDLVDLMIKAARKSVGEVVSMII